MDCSAVATLEGDPITEDDAAPGDAVTEAEGFLDLLGLLRLMLLELLSFDDETTMTADWLFLLAVV
jgi:hypothetical protein